MKNSLLFVATLELIIPSEYLLRNFHSMHQNDIKHKKNERITRNDKMHSYLQWAPNVHNIWSWNKFLFALPGTTDGILLRDKRASQAIFRWQSSCCASSAPPSLTALLFPSASYCGSRFRTGTDLRDPLPVQTVRLDLRKDTWRGKWKRAPTWRFFWVGSCKDQNKLSSCA